MRVFFKMRLDLQSLLIWGSSCTQITDGMKASVTRSLTRNSALRAAAKCVPTRFLSCEDSSGWADRNISLSSPPHILGSRPHCYLTMDHFYHLLPGSPVPASACQL